MAKPAQILPVRISKSDAHLLLVAPMPGIKPADISVTIAGRSLKIEGHQTGPGQEDKDMIMKEWTMGPYYRELELPEAVNGSLTNATFGNGVLTLAMPKASGDDRSVVKIQLDTIEAARGERIGHKGVEINPTH
jgi:HSP20 family protein